MDEVRRQIKDVHTRDECGMGGGGAGLKMLSKPDIEHFNTPQQVAAENATTSVDT